MNIRIPLRSRGAQPSTKIERAQLYNLDDNEYFQLQFNPKPDPRLDVEWTDDTWNGTARAHSQFLGIGPFGFDIPIILEVAPGAPRMPHSCSPQLMDGDGLVIIENVLAVILNWLKVRPDVGRPSLVNYIIGEQSYRGRIRTLTFGDEDRFPGGRLRHLMITLGFKQWRTKSELI